MTRSLLENSYNQSQKIWNKLVTYNTNTKEVTDSVVSEFFMTGYRLFGTTKILVVLIKVGILSNWFQQGRPWFQ